MCYYRRFRQPRSYYPDSDAYCPVVHCRVTEELLALGNRALFNTEPHLKSATALTCQYGTVSYDAIRHTPSPATRPSILSAPLDYSQLLHRILAVYFVPDSSVKFLGMLSRFTDLLTGSSGPRYPSVVLILQPTSSSNYTLHIVPEDGTVERVDYTRSQATTFRVGGAKELSREQLGAVLLHIGDGEAPDQFLAEVSA
nr:hypothetical protein CFP56_30015 [Quercus suber]